MTSHLEENIGVIPRNINELPVKEKLLNINYRINIIHKYNKNKCRMNWLT